jgi:hypothetical protein
LWHTPSRPEITHLGAGGTSQHLDVFTHMGMGVHVKGTSQYFLRQLDFLQAQPLLCPLPLLSILARKAFGFRAKVSSIACSIHPRNQLLPMSIKISATQRRTFSRISLCSGTFWHPWQLHPLHSMLLAKHSQYSFKHRDFLQLHCFCFPPP